MYITWAVVGVLLACTLTCDSQLWFPYHHNPYKTWCWEHTSGLRYCVCKDGYRFNDTGQCVDIDECASSPCGPNGNCVKSPWGSYRCGCLPGYQFINGSCLDIDECNWNPCGSWACKNYWGGFECLNDKCYGGLSTGDTNVCTDVDECELRRPICGQNWNCTNLRHSFLCQCPPGYQTRNGKCLATLASAGSADAVSDDAGCPIQNSCHRNATCRNLPGTYDCVCKDGFSGNGTHCEAVTVPDLPGVSPSPVPVADSKNFPPLIGSVVGGCSLVVLTVILIAIFVVKNRTRHRTKTSVNAHTQTMDFVTPSAVYVNQPVSARSDGSTAMNLYDLQDDETSASVYTTVGNPHDMNLYEHVDFETSASLYTTVRNPNNTDGSAGYCL